MRGEKMHSDEPGIDAALVARLIAAQFPQWANLPVVKLPSAGTDHALYRLADDMVVRLPRIPGVARQVDTEQRWLPRLAPQLTLEVPVPLGRGVPGQGFPMPWSVYACLDGENAFDRPIIDLRDAAIRDLGADGTIDGEAATAAWKQILAVPQWEGKPSWLHSDLMPGNLLTRHGRSPASSTSAYSVSVTPPAT